MTSSPRDNIHKAFRSLVDLCIEEFGEIKTEPATAKEELNPQDKFLQSFRSLVDLCFEAQDGYADQFKGGMNALQFAQEFQTVKIAGPRRIGHTSAIIDAVNRVEDEVIVVTPNEPTKRYLLEGLNKEIMDRKVHLYSKNELITNGRGRGRPPNTASMALFDISYFNSNNDEAALYRAIIGSMKPRCVFAFLQ